MKSVIIAVFLFVLAALGMGVVSAAQQEATLEKGKALFNDPKLGTSGKSCSTCHPDGKGLSHAGEKSDLARIVNQCISIPLQGKPLDPESMEMQSLLLYVKSLGAKKPAEVKKPAVGC
jgi:cytochrome c peroxidase